MYRVFKWLRNRKKWQIGGIIGCTVGILFAALVSLGILHTPRSGFILDLILKLHISLYEMSLIIISDIHSNFHFVYYSVSGFTIAVYTGYGMFVGSLQQVTNPRTRWILFGLSALILLIIYWGNFLLANALRLM